MSAFETLTTLLSALSPDIDVTFGDDIDVEDVDEDCEVQIKSDSRGEKAHVTREAVYLYPEKLQGEEYAKFQKLVREAKRSEGEVVRTDEKEETQALESADTTEIDEIIRFFDGVISNRHISILRSALYLRKLSETDEPVVNSDVGQKKERRCGKVRLRIVLYDSFNFVRLLR